MPGISVIIPSYNGRHHLGPCLEALLAGSAAKDRYEVLVVDNASVDGTGDWTRERFPSVRVVRNPENLGFTGAIASGVEAARGEVLVFLNNDTRPDREAAAVISGTLFSQLQHTQPPEPSTSSS